VRLVCLSGLDNIPLEVRQQAVVVPNQRELHLDARLGGGIRKALSHAGAVRLVGQLLAELRPVILAVRRLDIG
jgi:hypothetical protein